MKGLEYEIQLRKETNSKIFPSNFKRSAASGGYAIAKGGGRGDSEFEPSYVIALCKSYLGKFIPILILMFHTSAAFHLSTRTSSGCTRNSTNKKAKYPNNLPANL